MRGAAATAVAVLMAACVLLVLTGAGGDDAASPAREPTLRERLNLGVVAVDAQIGDERVRSSGTVVDARAGLVVTSAHAVWGATSLRLTTGLGVLHGRVVARAPCAGLAVIEIQPRVPGLVALTPATGEAPAEALLSAVGRRATRADDGADGLVTIPLRAAGPATQAHYDPGLPPLEQAIRLDGAVVPEASGGPLVDADGALLGIAMATSAGDEGALVVPWATVQAKLDELSVDERRIFVGWRSYYGCAPQLHAYARREHPAYRAIDARINAPVPATRLPGTEQLDEQ
jgi:S1-C subfamily serine protease